jgi:hypothetical protein
MLRSEEFESLTALRENHDAAGRGTLSREGKKAMRKFTEAIVNFVSVKMARQLSSTR